MSEITTVQIVDSLLRQLVTVRALVLSSKRRKEKNVADKESGQEPMRDDFTEEVKRILANRVANNCSNPECRAVTSGPQSDTTKALNVGVAAHITSASSGGPRFNPSLNNEQRCHADNGIWLCQNCAKLVDNDVQRFSEPLLRAWKLVAEDRALNTIGKTAHPHLETESEKKRRAILPHVGKIVTHAILNTGRAVHVLGLVGTSSAACVIECTEYYVKVGSGTAGPGSWERCIPLDNIIINFDSSNNRLELREKNE
jgi:hypothetical protein